MPLIRLSPDHRIALTSVRGHDAAAGVDHEDGGLPVRAERLCAGTGGIDDLGPVPAVALDEGAAAVRGVSCVDADERDALLLLDPPCVGDRLALAGSSP